MTVWQIVVAAGTGAGSLLAVAQVARVVWRYGRRVIALLEAVEVRSRELAPNGGGSVVDVTGITAARLAAVEAKVDGIAVELHRVADRMDRHLESRGGVW